jgi:predicted nucleic acid-binding protein
MTHDRSEGVVLPMSAYAEVLVGAYQHGSDTAAVIDAFLDALPAQVEPTGRAVARHAAELRARHRALRLPDAFVVATALHLRADPILTTDARWPAVGVPVDVV